LNQPDKLYPFGIADYISASALKKMPAEQLVGEIDSSFQAGNAEEEPTGKVEIDLLSVCHLIGIRHLTIQH
jgi:hypothetical protein